MVVGLRQPAERPLGQYERLAQVLSLTRDMLEHARQGAWDEVAQLEQTRRRDLQHCFARPVDAEHGELVAEALAVLLHLNEELMSLLGDAREAVLQQGARQARRRSALGEYHAVQRTPPG